MDTEAKEKILNRLYVINKERAAIVKMMEIIDSGIAGIKEIMKDIDTNYNRISIEINKDEASPQ